GQVGVEDVRHAPVVDLVFGGDFEGEGGVERELLLAGGRLDGGDDVAMDADLGEGGGRGGPIGHVVDDRLPEPDHTHLEQVFPLRADQEVRFDFRADQVSVLVQQVLRGALLALLGAGDGGSVRQIRVPEQAWARRLFGDDVNQNVHASSSLWESRTISMV